MADSVVALDGNTGLGGDPIRLISRLGCVLRPEGRILADLAAAPSGAARGLRLRHHGQHGPRFSWAPLHVDDLDWVAQAAALDVVDAWERGPQWYCELGVAGGPKAQQTNRTNAERCDGTAAGVDA